MRKLENSLPGVKALPKPLLQLITSILLCSFGPSLHALPPDVEQLIQADKYAEALAKVKLLLKATPDDRELLAAKQELTALAGKPAPAPAPVPARVPPKPAAPATPATIPPLDAKELDLILADLAKATGDARQTNLNELMSKTGGLVRKYPDIVSLWAMRSIGAIELSKADAAKEAGANLLRLGADRGANDQTLAVLATLKRKGWLKTQQELTDELAAERAAERAADARRAEARKAEEARRVAQQQEAARKAAIRAKSPEGIAERLRKQLQK